MSGTDYQPGQMIEYTSFAPGGWSFGRVVGYDDEEPASEHGRLVYLRAASGSKPFPVREDQTRLPAGLVIMTPCLVCASRAAEGNPSPFFAMRGRDWPVTKVASHTVHKACAAEARGRVRDVDTGRLVIDPESRVGRWASNGQAIPGDVAALFGRLGLTAGMDLAATEAARAAETQQALAAYRAGRAEHGYSQEELAEMRVEFGDEAVVDVITGEQINLCE